MACITKFDDIPESIVLQDQSRDVDATVTRYLTLVNWARRRYTRDGLLVVNIGGSDTAYVRIERAAWRRYMA